MNKYQKALDRLYSLKDGIKNKYPLVEWKKEEKFDDIRGVVKIVENDRKALQELVDKATPKQPILSHYADDGDPLFDECGSIRSGWVVCPSCKEETIYDSEYDKRFNFCSNCGQAIDWSE